MADNLTLNAGSGGSDLRTDELSGGEHVQYIKIMNGTADAEDVIPGDATDGLLVNLGANNDITGTVTANLGATDNAVLDAIVVATEAAQAALEGTLTVGSHAVTNAGTFAVQVDRDALTALQLIDNIVLAEDAQHSSGAAGVMPLAVRNDTLAALAGTDGDYAPLQVNASGALFIQEGAALDVSAATVTVDNGGTFATQVDGDALTALQKIDDAIHVDDAGFASGLSSGVVIMGYAGTQSVDANDAAALACDTDGALHISDGGNSITIDGTVDLGATDNAVLDDIAAQVTTLAGAVSTEMQVDVVGSLPAGTNAIGKLAANSGVDIGDVDVTSMPRATSHYRNIDANAEDEIKGSAGTLYWMHVINLTAAVAYLHLYDSTAASVTPGTTTPDFTFAIPTQGDTNGAGFNIPLNAAGHTFANGIVLVCTTTLDGSAGDPGTNGVIVNAGYA